MSWVKLDDGFFTNLKAVAAGLDGRALYIAGLCFCASGLTDGFIPADAVPVVAASAGVKAKLVARLVELGLWREVTGGYLVHDYLLYNPSREKVESDRKASTERQRRARSNGVTDGVTSSAPSSSRPDVLTSPPPLTVVGDGCEEDERLDGVWVLVARQRLNASTQRKTDPDRWIATVAADARSKLYPRAVELCAKYAPDQLAVSDLVTVLEGDSGPLRYIRPRATA